MVKEGRVPPAVEGHPGSLTASKCEVSGSESQCRVVGYGSLEAALSSQSPTWDKRWYPRPA